MKKKLIIALSLLCTVVAGKGFAESQYPCTDTVVPGPYVGVFGGANMIQIRDRNDLRTQAGYLAGVNIGYRFIAPFRLEGEVACRNNSYSYPLRGNNHEVISRGSMRVRFWTCMANLLREIPCNMALKPYLGFGIGTAIGSVKFKAVGHYLQVSGDKYEFAWQGIVGADLPLTDSLALGVQYRWFRFIRNSQTDMHSVLLTLRQGF